MGHFISMCSLMMETVIERLLMSILTSVMMMISKEEVDIVFILFNLSFKCLEVMTTGHENKTSFC